MAPSSDDLALAWASLGPDDGSGEGWRSIAISPAGSTLVHAGRRYPGGAESVLAQFSVRSIPQGTKWPEGGGFTVEPVALGDDRVWIALTRRDTASLELFAAMARDVGAALAQCPSNNEPKAFATLIGRVRAWQEFMRKGGQPLGAEAEIGLFGELCMLLRLLDEGVEPAVACAAWKGPLNGLRDFELGTGGIEVKSTVSTTGFPARVGSLAQLDDTERQPLFVAAYRLRQTQAGRTLAGAVQAARDAMASDAEAQRLLADRLIASGYRDVHAQQYVRTFVPAQFRVLCVGSGFPRLTPNSVPPGVTRATYDIDIDRVTVEAVDLPTALRDMKAI
ncbi:PD-(D/E)XK motif protein [Rhizobacter sp. AJA081-3]|uniref:PD-(D/E)XK motif protein n=1 Tax=Rhizobacter sp. AJA081-3 TaxID=2753607 RepID=UPI001AE07457|nr:PD-(D/E)XK motif protein [Rhizobacter sp. AJA081-3]QTN21781.1 PD-(D/E)XK motif protein [Rhizobacter sp. AJA081-3]